jgi:glycosyltransferase involved in cell wall biosynthesis
MKISVVTVCYNAEATVADALRSVALQDWPEVEHIVVDGASTDGTKAQIASSLRPGGRFISEPDRGIYDAMNKGIALATGEVIGLLNADDMYAHAGALRRVAGVFAEGPVDAVFGDVAMVDRASPDRIIRRYNSGRFRPSRLGWGWMPAHPATFLTRQAYARVGSYRTDYRIAADFEFIARGFGKMGLSYRYLPEILVRMRTGGVSTASLSAKRTINREVLRACRENGIPSNRLKVWSKYPLKLLEYLDRARAD